MSATTATSGVSYGQVRVVENQALLQLSGIDDSPSSLMVEYVDNGVDAGATIIWVVREPDSITFIDNGHGMSPKMLPDDRELLDMYFDSLAKQQGDQGDPRDYIGHNSMQSMEWLASAVCFSHKAKREAAEKNLRGRRGIGALVYRAVSRDGHATWESKTTLEIAQAYYTALRQQLDRHQDLIWDFPIPDRLTSVADIPTIRLDPPSNSAVSMANMRYQLSVVDQPLVNPDGQPLDHGTKVTIFDLIDDKDDYLRPNRMVSLLQKFFGEDIRTGRCKIIVVDKITDAGKRTPGGIQFEVPATSFQGTKLLDEARFVDPNHPASRYEVAIYYCSDTGDHRPMLRHRGRDIRPLPELMDFNYAPWTSGQLQGFVSFPDYSEEEAGWNTSKTAPRNTEYKQQWAAQVNNLGQEILAEIDKLSHADRQAKHDELGQMASQAITDVLRNLDEFKDLFKQSGPEVTKKPSKPKIGAVPSSVNVVVMNQFNRGVPEVPIVLWQGGRRIARHITGPGGSVTFGKVFDAEVVGQVADLYTGLEFRLQLELLEGLRSFKAISHSFMLNKEFPGITYIFQVQTREPAPRRPKLDKLNVIIKDWDQIGEPWRSDWMSTGRIEINSLSPHFRDAEERGDKDKTNTLIASYCASCVADFLYTSDPSEALRQQSVLFPDILARMKQAKRVTSSARTARQK